MPILHSTPGAPASGCDTPEIVSKSPTSKATNAESLGLDHMHAFIAVVESQSQVAAARRLRVTQGTISRHIERVQEHFGGGLFEAGSSGKLSTRGLLVEQSVRAALAELVRTRERIARSAPVLRIGFIPAARPLLEQALRTLPKVRGIPSFEVRLFELATDKQARALGRRELDIAISYSLDGLVNRDGIEKSLVADEPFALVIPERAFSNATPTRSVLNTLVYAHSPRRMSAELSAAAERYLGQHRLQPSEWIECEWGSEILAYAGAGYGYGFLPALWSMSPHAGVVFVPLSDFGFSARIYAYSLEHVTPWVTQLREHLSAAARSALRGLPT
jgi:DNA-binding transcriptional LysR family regulator